MKRFLVISLILAGLNAQTLAASSKCQTNTCRRLARLQLTVDELSARLKDLHFGVYRIEERQDRANVAKQQYERKILEYDSCNKACEQLPYAKSEPWETSERKTCWDKCDVLRPIGYAGGC